ncbi:MAG: YdeI/OmpD-associated family protein [Burkholderiaceae bacterium]
MPTRRAASDPPADDAPLRLDDPAAFDAWLARHHASSDGAWLQLAKAGTPGLRYAQALEVALCHGWIDGQKKSLDAHHFLQRFTPRRARSLWSKINRDKALALIAAGRMRPAGLAQVEAAKADGRWDDAYDGARSAQVPPDLQAALDARPAARAFFATLDGTNRYAVLWRVQTAKKPETRARRIEQLVGMLARGERIH